MPIKLGICGLGTFAQHFIPLFKRHPQIGSITLCDQVADRLKSQSEVHGISRVCPTLEELCQTDVDAIAIFTQNDRHSPQAVAALKAGKDVYSAVPSAISVQEITELVRTVEATGKIYMIGETSYYYPCAIYCRDRFGKGDFGQIMYSEAEYYHDFRHGGERVLKARYGQEWMRHATPPFYYPTHSTSMIVSTTGAYAKQVVGMGVVYKPQEGELDLYGRPDAIYNNPFADETMLCRMSDGSLARINEFRRVGYSGRPGQVGMRMYGANACFEEAVHKATWITLHEDKIQDLTAMLKCGPRAADDAAAIAESARSGLGQEAFTGVSPVHRVEQLPREFRGLPNGHEGSHQFLAHEFVTACADRRQPPNNVWQAARYLLPGLIAHESALQGGKLLDVPDFGEGGTARHGRN